MRIPEELRIVTHPLSLGDPERARAAKRGEVIHLALSLLSSPPSRRELETALRRALSLLGEDHGAWDLEALLRPLEALFRVPEVRAWFEAEAYPELEVVDGEGGLHRIDRVVLSGDGVEVIEYKVGQREPWHRGQVKGYVELLRRVFPRREVKGWLVYVDEGVVLAV